jgi:hypothetical protein
MINLEWSKIIKSTIKTQLYFNNTIEKFIYLNEMDIEDIQID